MKIADKLEFKAKGTPLCIGKYATVAEAIQLMGEKNYGSIVVTAADKTVEGILTERDLLTRVLYPKKDPETTKVSEIMTPDVRCARAEDDFLDWLRIMSNERFRHLPVVDEDNKLVGLMSQGDFVAYTWPDLFNHVKESAKSRFAVWFQIVFAIIALLVLANLLA